MGRSRGPEWAFVEVLRAIAPGIALCKCIYCGHEFQGGAQRIRAHIISKVGTGVDKCTAAPEIAISTCLRVEGSLGLVASNIENLEADDVIGISEQEGGEGNNEASSSQNRKEKRQKKQQIDIGSSFNSAYRDKANLALRRFFFGNAIPFNVVKSPFFQDMVKAIGQAGPSFKLPSIETLRVKELDDEVCVLNKELESVKSKWKKYGCTIVSDGWSDTTKHPMINFLASSIHGTIFLKAVDTSGSVKTGLFIFEHLRGIIEEVGPSNVVQVIMDNASNCIRAGEMVEETYPHIFFTRCSCHCLDLLFEDIGALDWIAPILVQARQIVTFVTRKQMALAIFRKHSTRELLQPSETRFAYIYIVLANLLDEKVFGGLRRMVVSEEWSNWRTSRTEMAEKVQQTILSSSFWDQAKLILAITEPILRLLRTVDREGATMGLVYEMMDNMVERIGNITILEATRRDAIKDLCLKRWEMMHSPLHAAGFMLHPYWRGKGQKFDHEVDDGWKTTIERYTKGDLGLQIKLIDQLDMYRNEAGSFSRALAKERTSTAYGVKWWESFGASTPELQALALHVLSQGSSASPCERNWSTFSFIHSKKRNRLKARTLKKLVFVHSNLRLMTRIKERGFEKMEASLEAIERERDVDRLLALERLREEVQVTLEETREIDDIVESDKE